jgi:hypothetical protein
MELDRGVDGGVGCLKGDRGRRVGKSDRAEVDGVVARLDLE